MENCQFYRMIFLLGACFPTISGSIDCQRVSLPTNYTLSHYYCRLCLETIDCCLISSSTSTRVNTQFCRQSAAAAPEHVAIFAFSGVRFKQLWPIMPSATARTLCLHKASILNFPWRSYEHSLGTFSRKEFK